MNVFTNNSRIQQFIRSWHDPSPPVPRSVYLAQGLVLAAVKYLGDVLMVYAATGTLWTPTRYLHALTSLFLQPPGWTAEWLAPAMTLWMLPFVARGITLTMRRALDAGYSPWLTILFLVPFLNYALIICLAVLPSRVPSPRRVERPAQEITGWTAVTAGAVGVMVAVACVTVGIRLINSYGGWLFILTPFAMGSCTGFLYNRRAEASSEDTTRLVVTTVLASGVALLTVAVEGLICLVMALPIAIPLAMLGGVVGRRAALSGPGKATPAMFMLLAVPLTALVEPATGRLTHEVRSSVVIEAPPEVVWPHVVAFHEIPPPTEWLFRAGVAYPIRARIEGTGVGAVRYCVFSTGAFIEPITRWEPGHRLSFDVAAAPVPMRELSPYRDLSPRHLHGYLRSTRGEFRFVDLGDGRTRLEGSTWYEVEMAPEAYWRIFSDALIHRIHQRVLDHIKREVENPGL